MAREEKRPLLVSVQKLLPTDYQKGLLAVVTSNITIACTISILQKSARQQTFRIKPNQAKHTVHVLKCHKKQEIEKHNKKSNFITDEDERQKRKKQYRIFTSRN
jgi:hypothetical protein